MTSPRGPDDPVETYRVADTLRLVWTCDYCGEENDRTTGGTPWNCDYCGQIDRDVEAFVDHYLNTQEGSA